MGKNKKKKKMKSHFLHVSQQMQYQARSEMTAFQPGASMQTATATATVNQPFFTPKIDDPAHKYDRQFSHVVPDLKYLGIMVVMMAVILAVVYYLDSSGGFVLKLGKQIYQLLHLS